MLAKHVPCARQPGCALAVTRQPDGSILGKCEHRAGLLPINHQLSAFDPLACPPTSLTTADLTPLAINWPKLSRALCKALGLDRKAADFGLPATHQIGSWSADAVPVILTIQNEPRDFLFVTGQLAARLRQKFILLAPTSRLVTAAAQEILANTGAAFFPLETTVTLTPNGTLHAIKTPGDLFAKFTPQPKELDEDVARRAFALVQQLDADSLAVFRFYCVEGMSAAQAARKCSCSKATVYRRLETIRAKTGIHPHEFRRLSSHFSRIEEQISDTRAASIYRKALANDVGDVDEFNG